MITEDRLKRVEENLAWLIKEVRELKEMRVVENHVHYTNVFNTGESTDGLEDPLY